MEKNKKCFHSFIKKNYPFGKKSKPRMICKECNKVVTPHELQDLRKLKRKKKYD